MEDKLPKFPGQESTEEPKTDDEIMVLVDIGDTTHKLSKADALMVAGRILATLEIMERNGN